MVKAGISHHVEEEEQEVFPQLRNSCDADRLDRLGRDLIRRKAQAGTLADDLAGATKETLTALAGEYGVDGRSSMTKAQLIEALSASTAA
jgi:hypothetical protein